MGWRPLVPQGVMGLRMFYLPDNAANRALQPLPDISRGFFEPQIVDSLH